MDSDDESNAGKTFSISFQNFARISSHLVETQEIRAIAIYKGIGSYQDPMGKISLTSAERI